MADLRRFTQRRRSSGGSADIEILGLRELEQEMRRFPDKVARRMLARAVGKATLPVKREAKSIAKAEAFATGALQRNIRTKRAKRSPAGVVRYMVGVEHGKTRPVNTEGQVKGRRGKLRSATRREKAGEDPFYYHFIELGTRRGIAPIRYLTRALEGQQTTALEAMRTELKKQIAKEYQRKR